MRGRARFATAATACIALVAVAVVAGVATRGPGDDADGDPPAAVGERRGAAVALDPAALELVSPVAPARTAADGTVEVSGLLHRALPSDHELWVVTRRAPSGGVEPSAELGRVTVGGACDVVGGEFSCGSVTVGKGPGRYLLDVLVADPDAAAGLVQLGRAQRDGGTGPRAVPGSVAALPPVEITR